MRKAIVLLLIILGGLTAFAQHERRFIRQGNDAYEQGNYGNAQVAYEKALNKKAESFKAQFNQADALYKNQEYEKAAGQFGQLAARTNNTGLKAKAYHNLGNAHLKNKKIDKSIQAYKNALRLNPNDGETRYNLAYAQRLKQQQQQKKEQKNKNKQNKQDKQQNKNQQNKQNQQKQKQQQDKQKQQQQAQDKKSQQQQQQGKQQQRQISRDEAERLLKMLESEEKKVQQRVKKQKAKKAKSSESEKEW